MNGTSTETSTLTRGLQGQRLTLVRLAGELAIKSRRTRAGFERRLVKNLRDALDGLDATVESEWDRIFITSPTDEPLAALPRVFGLSSFSAIDAVVPGRLEDILDTGEDMYRDRVAGKRFAIRARRHGHHGFSSRDIMVDLGNRLLPHSDGVNLDHPDITIHVEVREDTAYLFEGRTEGAGGLPLGVEGRAVALLSGGYDSAVAAWMLLKRGVELDYVFCNLGGDAYERAVVQVAKLVADDWSYGHRPRLHVVDITGAVDDMRRTAKPSYWQVVLKRIMYRAASWIGNELGAEAIITGECIGQVSSQTLTNLRAIEPAATLPLLRPLLGFDKNEIIDHARRIGTAGLSEQVKEYCAIAPGKPVTAASVQAVDREDERLDHSILRAAVSDRKVLDLRRLTATDLVAPYLFTDAVPDNAAVLDIRPPSAFRAWHLPGATHHDEWELLQGFQRLDRDRHYVLLCAHGIQSAHIAEKMQRAGYEAYSFRGGIRRAIDWARQQGLPLPS